MITRTPIPTVTKTKAQKKHSANVHILRAKALSRISWLVHGFSTRVGGHSQAYGENDLNLGFTAEDQKRVVERNRADFLQELDASSGTLSTSTKIRSKRLPLITLRQVHSDIIHVVESIPAHVLAGDGLLTATPGLLLAIQTADCLPVILVDIKRHAVGVFHAGWRGTAKRIVEKGVGQMHRYFGSQSGDLKAAIGPGIHSCCYDVGEEVRTTFESQFAYGTSLFREVKDSDPVREKYPLLFLTARAPGHSALPKKIFLDLAEANRRQLVDAGVPAKSIDVSDLCTRCRSDLLFSYRAERGRTGRMMSVAGIKR